MNEPVILDFFSGAGGCSVGYARAGFRPVGIDNRPQKHYPYEFIQGDATDPDLLLDLVRRYKPAALHGSPPCQDHMRTPNPRVHDTGWMLPWTRTLFEWVGLPWVIENVPGAPMRPDYLLCGCMFGLRQLRRERWFETSWQAFALSPDHDHREPAISVVGHGTPTWVRQKLGYNPTIAQYRAAMGIDWMNRDELSQAIPPAYTELIGAALLEQVAEAAA